MLLNNLTPLLNDLNITPNTWTYPDELFQIILTTDLNQSMYPGREMVYFDTVNETVKIKRFNSTAVSGFASGLRYGADSNILVPAIQFYRNFRSPKVGDFIYLYSGTALELSGTSFKKAKIVDVFFMGDRVQLSLDTPIITSNRVSFLYSGLSFETLNFTEFTTTHYKFLKQQSLLVEMKPISKAPFDMIYSLDFVSGLEIQNASEVY